MIEQLTDILEMMRRDNERMLEYEDGSIGITSLLYCPRKIEYKKLYPDLKAKSVAIDDGFLFEKVFIPYFEKVFVKVYHEPAIPFQFDGFKIVGHPDVVIEQDDKVVVLEFKAPISVFMKADKELPEDDIILDVEGIFNIAEHYITQARIQKRIVREFYQKPVDAYLFVKTTIANNKKKKYILKPVDEITDDELSHLIDDFQNKKEPRYAWECGYCVYQNVCVKEA